MIVLLTVFGLSNKQNEEKNLIFPFADEIVTNTSFVILENTFVLEKENVFC